MNSSARRAVVIVLALLLVVPAGLIGIGQIMGPSSQEGTAQNPDDRPTADPADQPPRPELPSPEAPPELTEQTPAGAEATLAHMLTSYDYMMSSGDVSVWEQSVDPKCQVCVRFLENAELLDKQGGYLVGGAFDVRSTTFEGSGDPPATGTVVADFTQESSVLVDDPNYQATPIESVSGQLIATMAWDGERWRVTDMSIAPPPGASDDGGADGTGGAPGGGGVVDGAPADEGEAGGGG